MKIGLLSRSALPCSCEIRQIYGGQDIFKNFPTGLHDGHKIYLFVRSIFSIWIIYE